MLNRIVISGIVTAFLVAGCSGRCSMPPPESMPGSMPSSMSDDVHSCGGASKHSCSSCSSCKKGNSCSCKKMAEKRSCSGH